MAKNIGPCFDFVISKEGARVDFILLPGNVAKKIFEDTRDTYIDIFQKMYGQNTSNQDKSDYIKKISLEDGTETIAIRQDKVLGVVCAILGSKFKVRFTGVTNTGEQETIILNSPLETKLAAKYVPYYNKSNNDITSRKGR